MNCPHCAKIVPNELAHCPHCGTPLRAMQAGGSAVLHPQDETPGSYPETPLIDHGHAMRRLRAAWRHAHVGYGQVVSIVGENGSGRSRLIRELGGTVDQEAPQARWLIGRAYSHATYLPYHLLADFLAPWAGDAAEQESAARLATALERLADAAPIDERWPLLAFAREVREPEGRGGPPIVPLAEALARALWRVAGGAPLVAVLEDLEWADAASLAVFDALLAALSRGPALILCTHHGDWSHEWPDIARHAQLFLGALSHADSQRMVAAIAGDRPLATTTVEALAFAAGGNPLLLEQVTWAMLERGVTAGDAPVPATLADAIQARLALLPPTAREALLAAAAIGPEFVYRAIAMVTEATLPDRRAIDEALQELARRRLIIRWDGGPEVRYRFGHALIQEVAYGALTREQRAAFEARVADWMLSEGALRGRPIDRVVAALDQRGVIADKAARGEDRVLVTAPQAAAPRPAPTPIDQKRRSNVLARIVLADLNADQRACLAFCLQHGYSYAEVGDLLGIGAGDVRESLYSARKLFKRLYEASALTPDDGRAGDAR